MLGTAGVRALRAIVGVAIVAFVTAPWSAVPAQVTDCSGQIDGTPCDDGNVCTLSQSCMSGFCAPPPAQTALSGGAWNTCALRSSGRLSCWGDDGYHEVSGPNASADRFSAIACGSYHTCALRIDGRLACWGEPPIGYGYDQVSGPNADPDSYIAVSGGNYHTCALHTDGRLACWGYDTGGQVSGPNASADLYIAVSGGGASTCALRTDGRIACWGYDSKGQVSGPNASPDIFTALSAGNEHTCAVRWDGRIACWGLDTLGQVSGPNAANEQYSSVSAGFYHTCAVRADGRLACWGHDNYGQASGPSASTEDYTAVDVGPLRTCAIRANGRLVCWGYDLRGEVSGPNASEGLYGLNQLDCDDGNPCTDDSCDASSGCIHTPNTLPCDDGSACTRVDTCSDGACLGADPVVCTALDQCHVPGICDPGTGVCSSPSQPDGTVCSDGNWCTGGDACQEGSCTPTFNGLDEPNPRTNAYYKRLCRGPHSGDQLTDADAWCVARVTTTFAGISTVAQICDVIEPSHPNSDKCGQTEDDLIVLALNICRARVCVEQPIASRCGGNTLVGASLAESDAILLSPSRNFESRSHAKCLDEEVNCGSAILADAEP